MSHVVVIGGTGHIGSYLIPRLVDRGFQVTNISRGSASPYRPHNAWKKVKMIVADRKAEDLENKFAPRVVGLEPDIVIDLMAYEPAGVEHLVDALRNREGGIPSWKIEHYLFCSTIWVYGHLTTVPSTENEPLAPIDDYGTKKKEIEEYLNRLAKTEGFPATSFRPGHIVGEGWNPINPAGHANPDVFTTIAQGRELCLPNQGLEMLHHVHADDVALWVMCALSNRAASIGESFNNVSSQSLTMRGYAEAMYRYFGKEPLLTYKPLAEFKSTVSEQEAQATNSHVMHSPCASIEKSRKRLGYEPRYTSLEAIQESVRALIAIGRVKVEEQ